MQLVKNSLLNEQTKFSRKHTKDFQPSFKSNFLEPIRLGRKRGKMLNSKKREKNSLELYVRKIFFVNENQTLGLLEEIFSNYTLQQYIPTNFCISTSNNEVSIQSNPLEGVG